MLFGAIDKILIFGGGKKVSRFLPELNAIGIDYLLVTSPRYLTEIVDKDIQFGVFLKEGGHRFISVLSLYCKEVLNEITDNTLGISIGGPWVFKKDFIDRFNGKLVNLHPARLPQNRGGGGFSWKILRQDMMGASLIHKIDPDIDTGDIIKYEEYIFPPHCKKPSDYDEYCTEKDIRFLQELIKELLDQKIFHPVSQQDSFSTYFPRLNSELHGYIDWNWNYDEIDHFIQAFDDPYCGASTFLNGQKVRLKDCHSTTVDGSFHPFQSGIVYRIYNNKIFIAAKMGSLIIETINREDGRSMIRDINVGDRFYTPQKFLEEARSSRIRYTPGGKKISTSPTSGG